tara:strand:- start:39 stop:728 length:690 start_codon:yes stop_codon:yes gene_type:complete
MLALKQALSLGKTFDEGIGWTPLDEASLEAWYQKGVGITLDGTTVEAWSDSSVNSNLMRQTTEANQPEYSGGVLTFEATASEFLSLVGADITLADAFTIGIKLNITSAGGIILGDTTDDGEFIKVFSSNKIRIKIDNATAIDLQLDAGSLLGTEAVMVLTRAGDDTISLHWNGTEQADTEDLSGTANIDAIGIRKDGLNPFDGTIEEIQIYNNTSDVLVANVNASLEDL